jgi:hypothetical protein
MAKYRVLQGCHAEGFYPVGHPQAGAPIVYEPGEVLETENCLLKHNAPGSRGDKFQLIDDDRVPVTDKIAVRPVDPAPQPAAQENDGLDRMSIAELRELSRGDGIELGSAKTKVEILRVMREAYAPAT